MAVVRSILPRTIFAWFPPTSSIMRNCARQVADVERAPGATESRVHQWRGAPRARLGSRGSWRCRESGRRRPGPFRFEIRELREAHGRPRHGSRCRYTLHAPQRSRSSSTLPAFGRADKAFQYQRTFPTATYTALATAASSPTLLPISRPADMTRMKCRWIRPQTLYSQKLNGNGQVVVLVDAYGPTRLRRTPTLSRNQWVAGSEWQQLRDLLPTGPQLRGNTCGWDTETSLDVECHTRWLREPSSRCAGGRRLLHQP